MDRRRRCILRRQQLVEGRLDLAAVFLEKCGELHRLSTAGSGFFASFGFEGLGDHLPVGLLQQNLHAAFSLFELLLALSRKLDAFFKQLHGFIERELGVFESLRDLFQAGQRALKIGLLGWLRFFARCWVHFLAPAKPSRRIGGSALAARTEETGAPALFDPANPAAATPAVFALPPVYAKHLFKALEPPLRVAKIRRRIETTF